MTLPMLLHRSRRATAARRTRRRSAVGFACAAVVAVVPACRTPADGPRTREVIDLNPPAETAAATEPSPPAISPDDAADAPAPVGAERLLGAALDALREGRLAWQEAVNARNAGQDENQWRPLAERAAARAAAAHNLVVEEFLLALDLEGRAHARRLFARVQALRDDCRALLGALPEQPPLLAVPAELAAPEPAPPPVAAGPEPPAAALPPPSADGADRGPAELRARWRDRMQALYAAGERDPTLLRWLIDLRTEDREFEEALALLGDLPDQDDPWVQTRRVYLLDQLGDAGQALRHSRRLYQRMQDEAPLSLESVTLVASRYGSVRGLGQYDRRDSNVYRPGDYLKLYLEVWNFARRPAPGESWPQCDFTTDLHVLDAAGRPVAWEAKARELTRARTDGAYHYPRRFQAPVGETAHLVAVLHLPAGADTVPAGEYRLVFALTDHQRVRYPTAQAEVPFVVR